MNTFIEEAVKEAIINKNNFSDPKYIEVFISQKLEEAMKLKEEEILELVEYDERHAPKSPQDITTPQQGSWYLGRIDGLQSIESKIKSLHTEGSSESQIFHRTNTKNSLCIYCGHNIGLEMKCAGCGHIDPPVSESKKEEKV